jgi:hypothetical protein
LEIPWLEPGFPRDRSPVHHKHETDDVLLGKTNGEGTHENQTILRKLLGSCRMKRFRGGRRELQGVVKRGRGREKNNYYTWERATYL